MNTICPNCQTEFNIPDDAYRPGRKARCAICAYVFILPELPAAAKAQAQPPATPVKPQSSPQAVRQSVSVSVRRAPQAAKPAAPEGALAGTPPKSPPQSAASAAHPADAASRTSAPAAPVVQPEAQPDLRPASDPESGLPRTEPESFTPAEPAAILPDDLEDFFSAPPPEVRTAEEKPAGGLLREEDAHASYAEAAAKHAFGAATQASAPKGAAPDQDADAPVSAEQAAAAHSDDFASDFEDFINQGNHEDREQSGEQAREDDLEAILAGSFNAAAEADSTDEPYDFAASGTSVPPAAKKSGLGGKLALGVAFLVCLSVLGFGGYWVYISFMSGGSMREVEQKIASLEDVDLEKIRNLDVKASGIRYDYIRNEKLGTILVLEGKVTNKFNTPKNKIVVEARLFNSKGELLKSQRQIAGVVLSPLQLSVLGQKELVKALNNRIEIMANNMGVMPGQEVPFMVVFVYPPTNAVEFDVTVVDASDTAEPPAPVPQ